MPDQTIICTDCLHEFVFTQDEQEFYAQKNLKPPKYCPICRGKYKAQQAQFSPYQKKHP